MARPLFTQEQVFEVADGLAAEGKEVTALLLLSKLGGASLTTIYKHLIAWRDARKQDVAPATAQAIPETVQAAFATALGRAWAAAASEAASAIAIAKEKASEEVQTANKQFDEAMQAVEKLEEQSDMLEGQVEGLKTNLAEWEAIAHTTQAECAAHKATIEQLEKQNGKQERDFGLLRTEAEEERDQHKQAQNLAAATIEQVKIALKKAEESATKFEAEVREQCKVADQKQQVLEKAEQASQADRAERDAAMKEAAQAHGQAEALKDQNSELLSRLGDRGKQGSKGRDHAND